MNQSHTLRSVALMAATASLLTACVDERYDFNNFDSTCKVEVNDLTLPVKLDPISFGSLVELEGDQIKVVDGKYLVDISGSFTTDPIHITPFSAQPDQTNSSIPTIPMVNGIDLSIAAQYPFEFQMDWPDVDAYILGVTSAHVDFRIYFNLTTGARCTYENLTIRVPKGMHGYVEGQNDITADSDGMLVFPTAESDPTFSFVYHVTEIENLSGTPWITHPNGIGRPGSFHLAESIAVVGGTVSTGSITTLDVTFYLGSIDVKNISGSLYYDLDPMSQTVALTDIPEELRGPDTQLSFKDAKLDISLVNPMEQYGLTAKTGISLAQQRSSGWLGESAHTVSTTQPIIILAEQGQQTFTINDGNMPGLGNILFGQGLPEAIDFSLVNPGLPEQSVTNFPLGYYIDPIELNYSFTAPLDFGPQSQIVYSHTQEWDLGDTDDIEVTKLAIASHCKSDIPVDITLEAYPLIGDDLTVDRSVELEIEALDGSGNKTNTIRADYDGPLNITLRLNGTHVANIKGIYYSVKVAAPNGTTNPLGPDMNFDLTDFSITVSGSYLANDLGGNHNDDDDDDDDDYNHNNYDYGYDYE